MPTPPTLTPRLHPIASLPLVGRTIDGQLEAAEEQHRLLLQARACSLDDAIVERVVRVYTEEVDLLAIYHEQLDRWGRGHPDGRAASGGRATERAVGAQPRGRRRDPHPR